jgi:hypothetical protein
MYFDTTLEFIIGIVCQFCEQIDIQTSLAIPRDHQRIAGRPQGRNNCTVAYASNGDLVFVCFRLRRMVQHQFTQNMFDGIPQFVQGDFRLVSA